MKTLAEKIYDSVIAKMYDFGYDTPKEREITIEIIQSIIDQHQAKEDMSHPYSATMIDGEYVLTDFLACTKCAEAYAKYYAKALIESLTDEEIELQYPMRDITGSPKSLRREIHFTNNMAYKRKEGAEWAREELLKRINEQ